MLFRKGAALRRSILLPLLFIVAACPSFSQGQAGENTKRNEYPFQCGAMFAIVANVYEDAGEISKSAVYKAKFEKLALKAEADFEKFNRTKADAEAYMQKHVDSLAAIAEKDADVLVNFARRCNELFPD